MDDLIECIPVLPSLDLQRSRQFYEGELGFGVIYDSPTRLIVRREAMELHFWLTDRPELCENSSCYLRGGGVDQLYWEFGDKGVARLSEFEERAWGMKEFYVHDPDGNLLTFARVP